MKDKFFICLLIAPFLILFLTLGAVEVVSMKSTNGAHTQPQKNLPLPVADIQAPPSPPPNQTPTVVLLATLPDKDSLHDSDIQNLAKTVHITQGAKISAPDKKAWAMQLPIAKALTWKMCNCEQRNWLNRFIMTGNEAVTGSDGYYQSAEILVNLPHHNQEFAAGVSSPGH